MNASHHHFLLAGATGLTGGLLLRELLADRNTCIYVCGLKGMEVGVLDALREVTMQAGQDWTILHAALRREGRLHFETY